MNGNFQLFAAQNKAHVAAAKAYLRVRIIRYRHFSGYGYSVRTVYGHKKRTQSVKLRRAAYSVCGKTQLADDYAFSCASVHRYHRTFAVFYAPRRYNITQAQIQYSMIYFGKKAAKLRTAAEVLLTAAAYSMSFVFSAQIKSGIANALSLCAKIIIPSVFPITVISNTLLLRGLPKGAMRVLSSVSNGIFGLSGNSAACLLFGLTGGYSVGVKNARLMHSQKLISAEEARRLCLVAVSPGVSFTVTVCGALFSSVPAGITLFLSCIAANTAIGFILKLTSGTVRTQSVCLGERKKLADSFLTAVEKSTSAVISVCSFILVFSSVSAFVGAVLPTGISEPLTFLFEVTGGVQLAAEKNNIIIAAFLCGFGGISAGVQLLPDLKALGVNLRTFFLCRAASGLLAALFEFGITAVFRLSFPAAKMYTGKLFSDSFSVSLLLFGTVLMLIISSLEGGIHLRNNDD